MKDQTTPLTSAPRPCHVIAGPLGVGKTTAIIDYVRRHAPDRRVAVLVNDFGELGLDGAIIEGAVEEANTGPLRIVSIPGGCICCVAADGLIRGLAEVAQMPDIDRIMIEPSGLAMPHQIIDLLRQPSQSRVLTLRPVILMMDASNFHGGWRSEMPYFRNMVESADILVANRTDLAEAQTVVQLRDWAAGLYPPKLCFIATEYGRIPDEVFELTDAPRQLEAATLDHQHDVTAEQTGSRSWHASIVFKSKPLFEAIESCAQAQLLLRLKAIFHTDRGWERIEYARGNVDRHSTAYRHDSRIEWIAQDARNDEIEQWATSLELLRVAEADA
jgi:G3E family GTPase